MRLFKNQNTLLENLFIHIPIVKKVFWFFYKKHLLKSLYKEGNDLAERIYEELK